MGARDFLACKLLTLGCFLRWYQVLSAVLPPLQLPSSLPVAASPSLQPCSSLAPLAPVPGSLGRSWHGESWCQHPAFPGCAVQCWLHLQHQVHSLFILICSLQQMQISPGPQTQRPGLTDGPRRSFLLKQTNSVLLGTGRADGWAPNVPACSHPGLGA